MHPSLIPRRDAPEGAGWTLAEALATYGIKAWGQGYFGVNEAGNLTVMPEKDPARAVDLLEVVEGLRVGIEFLRHRRRAPSAIGGDLEAAELDHRRDSNAAGKASAP